VPNPGLAPETAWSFEVGQRAMVGPVGADAALFWTEAYHLIEPVVNPVSLQIQFQNLTRARLLGLDLAATATPLPALTTSLAYTFLYARELAQTGGPERPLAFRPRHVLMLGADYRLGSATLGADFRYVSRIERVVVFEGDRRVAATTLDVRAAVARGPLASRLLVTNALNYIHTLVPRNLRPARAISLTVSWEY
jgi:outer membrane receptor protein involved in Fe transport